ncbi:hypothetical protein ACNPMZ_05140 [Acinetobacter pittii]|uniref:hypothetical protein n=2 Tax=Acinetobacter calcoaceticus/baumannii complex TaxID=909768 RepID=UPI003AA7F97B
MELQEYDWPGNIRKLQNVIECVMIAAKYDAISFEYLLEQAQHEKESMNQSEKIQASSSVLIIPKMRGLEMHNLTLVINQFKGKI